MDKPVQEFRGDKIHLDLLMQDFLELKIKIDRILIKYGIENMDYIELCGILSDNNRAMSLFLCKDRQEQQRG